MPVASERERERDSVVAYSLLQPARPSRPVRGRVCHFTGTRAAANIHTSSFFLDSYVVYPLSITRKRRLEYSTIRSVGVKATILSAASSLNSCLVSLVSGASALRLQRGSYSLPHRLIDAPTAPLTTPSLRRRVSVHSTGATNAERTPKGENIIRLFRLRVASRRVASRGRPARPAASQTQQSRARRCSA